MGTDYTLGKPLNRRQQRIWDIVSRFPLRSLWNLQGISLRVVAQRTWRSLLTDNIFGHAAELGFYFLFALFPTLFSASSILGLAAPAQADTAVKTPVIVASAINIPTDYGHHAWVVDIQPHVNVPHR